jgi:CheY-like chemotaxis protein
MSLKGPEVSKRHRVSKKNRVSRQNPAPNKNLAKVDLDMARVLIVEDNALIACDLHAIVDGAGHAVVGVATTVREARALLGHCDAALLDVDVRDGKTFELAASLAGSARHFMFVTGSLPQDLPQGLKNATFLQKPYRESDICRWLNRLHPEDATLVPAMYGPSQTSPLSA